MKNGCYHLLPDDCPDRPLITDKELYCVLLAKPCQYDSEERAKEACELFDHPTKE